MNKIIATVLVAATVAVAFAAPSEARNRHLGRNGLVGLTAGIIIGAAAVSIYDETHSSCYTKKKVRWDRWGNKIVKKVTYCD